MTKPKVYAEIPEFNQATQAVLQEEPIDMGDHIFYGVRVEDLPPSEGDNEEEGIL